MDGAELGTDNCEMLTAMMNKDELIRWLRETDDAKLETLFAEADRTRHDNVGDAVHLRGLIEISNCCVRQCAYCGIRAGHRDVQRYRMTEEEILASAAQGKEFGYGTVVMQAGEDYGLKTDWLCHIIGRIKNELDLAITLSLGERPDADLVAFRRAGADRYLLRFETSNESLYRKIHPSLPGTLSDRIAILKRLAELDYEVGSGIMIGIPGQTYDILAEDILLFNTLGLDMIGVGPFIPHPQTPLGQSPDEFISDHDEQVPNTEAMTYKVVALTRLMCPWANIPSTTALATLNTASGRELGLSRGANIVMPNLTPVKYRAMYEIYPAKACLTETAADCRGCIQRRIRSIGRQVGTGPGESAKRDERRRARCRAEFANDVNTAIHAEESMP